MRLSAIFALVVGAMCFIATTKLPYGYFTLLRIAVTAACLWFVFEIRAAHTGSAGSSTVAKALGAVFGLIAVLFNPIIPIYLNRKTWQPIDIVVGSTFVLYALLRPRLRG